LHNFFVQNASNLKFELQYTIKYTSKYNKFFETKIFLGIPIHILLYHSSLCYKSEGLCFDSRLRHWNFSVT